MLQIIRIIVSLLLSVEMIFGSLFSGSAFRKIKMPELPHMQELSEQMDTMKQNPQLSAE